MDARFRAAATRWSERGDHLRAARVWRRLIAGREAASPSDMRGLGRSCLALAARGEGGRAAVRCAALAFEAADGADQVLPPPGDRLSSSCSHIRSSDVDFLRPHVPLANASWRALFNTAGTPRGRGRHRGKVFGLGLSKTGVTSLREALRTLGWRRTAAMGFDFYPRVVDEGARPTSDALREYFAEATTDLPYALFAPELLRAFPSAAFVLTTRAVAPWWRSVRRQMAAPYPADHPIGRTRTLAYGQPSPHERLYTRRFVAHALEVLRAVPCERLLLLDVLEGGDGWERLAPFLRVPLPDAAFPHLTPAPTPELARQQSAARDG